MIKQILLVFLAIAISTACKKDENDAPDNGDNESPDTEEINAKVTMIAGSETEYASKDNANPLDARFIDPRKLVWDDRNNTLYVLDAASTSDLRKIDQNGVSTVGRTAFGVFIEGFDMCKAPDGAGVLYVSTSLGQLIKVDTNIPLSSTNPLAIIDWRRADGTRKEGNETGSLDEAGISGPYGVAAVPAVNGKIYFSNSYYLTIHQVNFDKVGNEVNEFAGKPTEGVSSPAFPFSDGVGNAATFGAINDMAIIEDNGKVIVADPGYCTVREITPSGKVSTYLTPSSEIYLHYKDTDGPLNKASSGEVYQVAANKDGSRIFFSTWYQHLRVILPGENRVVTLTSFPNAINGIASTPDGKVVYVSSGRAIYKVEIDY